MTDVDRRRQTPEALLRKKTYTSSRVNKSRHLKAVELLILLATALWMASFFSPALPRLHLPLARWTGVFFGALVLLLSYYAFRRRWRLAGAWRWALLFLAILLLLSVTRIPFLLHHQASLNSDRSVTPF